MSKPISAVQNAHLVQRQWRKWIVALVVAVALAGLPMLASGPLSPLFAQAVQAGCNLGGTCG